MKSEIIENIKCVHCGDVCRDETLEKDGNVFCCSGCLFVYDLLNDVSVQKSYDVSKLKSISPKPVKPGEYDFLDDSSVIDKLIHFSINARAKVTFQLPNIYCSACIWLLENISRMDPGIKEAKVNFLKKEVSVLYSEEETSLKKVAELLASIGYRPRLNLADLEEKTPDDDNRSLIIKLGIAAFCFANIMLFALPEYLSFGSIEENIKVYLRFLSFFASVPVLYSASVYFKSAWASIKLKMISIDIPLSVGIIALFLRSAYEVFTYTGSGYSDSLSGLLFFLLLGKIFQKKTFYTLSFDRDYKSYFPMSVIRKKGDKEEYVSIKDIKIGNTLIIRNNEIIPTDSILQSQSAVLDYSFVTGEANPIALKMGDKIYSGAKQLGATIEINVLKNFQQSYMTELWDSQLKSGNDKNYSSVIADTMAKYFTMSVLLVAFGGLFYWAGKDINLGLNAFVSVLIVACPCALAITTPFAYGTVLRIFSKKNFYLKNDKIVEMLTRVTKAIFDKTGTLTETEKSNILYSGSELSPEEKSIIKSAVRNSTHPYSRILYDYFKDEESYPIDNYNEIFGQGIDAVIKGRSVKIGKKSWQEGKSDTNDQENISFSEEASVFISFDNIPKGSFSIKSKFREGIFETVNEINSNTDVSVLSGDMAGDEEYLRANLRDNIDLYFEQKPAEKLTFVKSAQINGKNVMMVGDGLNDAGALRQSNIGIAVTDNTSNFTPGSDAILNADSLKNLPAFLRLARKAVNTVYISYTLSILYNLLGFSYALTGHLSPVIAALLMPISSVTVVAFTVLKITVNAKNLNLK